jgi:hypothetical protein
MRPLMGHREQGRAAYVDAVDISDNPYPTETLGWHEWVSGHMEAALESGDLDDDAFGSLSVYSDDMDAARKHLVNRLRRDLPTCTAVADAIGIAVEDWKGKCYGVASAALECGILDRFQEVHGRLIPVYGLYLGDIDPGGCFGKTPLPRHGWLESLSGLVLDPTRWVFTGAYPELWLGSTSDYDLGGMRVRPQTRMPQPAFDDCVPVALGINDPSDLAAFDRVLGHAGRVRSTGAIGDGQLRWLLNRPVETLGADGPLFIRTAERIGVAAHVPWDTREWYKHADAARMTAVAGLRP